MLAAIDYRAVQTSAIQCANGMDAFLAVPGTPGPHPSMVLMHERYGLVQHTKDLATRFATEGYITICPNLFFRDTNQEEIARGNAAGNHTDDQVAGDVDAAVTRLALVPEAISERFFTMGVCMSGRYPLVLAARRSDIDACLVFYGGTPGRADGREPIENIIAASQVPVLGVFGEADHGHSIDAVQAFRDALERSRRSYHVKMFEAAPHGFLNDTMPGRYRRPQAEGAWQLAMEFLKRVRSGGYPPNRVQWKFESDISRDIDFSKNVRYE